MSQESFRMFPVGPRGVLHWRKQIKGKRTQQSTGETDPQRAVKKAKKKVEDLRVVADGFRPAETLAAVVAEWLDIMDGSASAHYYRAVDRFARRELYGLKNLPINRITDRDILKARKAFLKAGHSLGSARQWQAILHRMFTFAADELKMLDFVPWKVKKLKPQRKPKAILPPSKTRLWFAAVAKASRGWQVPTAVRLMRYLGLREAETWGARWEWIDWDRGTYTPGITKNRKAEPLKMPQSLIRWLLPLRQSSGWILPKSPGKLYKPGFCRCAMAAANLACDTPGITPHRLRGTCATILHRKMGIKAVQRFMRHSKVETTLGYIEEDFEEITEAQDQVDEEIGE